MRLVGMDVGNRVSVACAVELEDFQEYPHTKAHDFFDELDFIDIEGDQKGLDKLVALQGDVYVYEPTGRYHKVWTENLEALNLNYVQVSNNKLDGVRKHLEFPKDDPHDALALTYYYKDNRDNPKAFLRVRDADLQTAWDLLYEIERINKELRPIKARIRILLKSEFPEYARTKERAEGLWGFWLFVAGQPVKTGIYEEALKTSIGSAKRNGAFSEEVIELAETIIIRMNRKIKCQELINSIINKDKYADYHVVFDKFRFGDMLRAIILCQIYPLENFLDDKGNELKRKLRKRKTKNGHSFHKRIAYRRFHSLLGKGIKRKQSGDKDIRYVSGSVYCRNLMTLWVSSAIINPRLKTFTPITESLLDKYYNDVNASTVQLEKLKGFSLGELEEAKPSLETIGEENTTLRRIGEILSEVIEDMAKKKTKGGIGNKGGRILNQWAKARVSDKAIKILFRELINHWKAK